MLREKEIEYFRKNILPYYIQQLEEQEQLERIYQERKKARIKYMQEVEEAKRLKREQKLQEKEEKRLKKEQEKQVLKEQKRIERERQKQLRQEQKKLDSGKYKRCNTCGQVLKLTEFYKHPLKKQGVFDYCKTCACIKQMQHRKSKIERKENQQEILHT